MPFTGQQLVEQSLEMWKRANLDAQMAFYERLADHATGDMAGEMYFPQGYAESDDRYQKRPKEALPLCSSALEVLTGHTVGDGLMVSVGEDGSREQAIYDEIQDVNDLDGEHAVHLVQLASVFGWCCERILPSELPVTRPDQIEFEAVDPRAFAPFYNMARIGGTKNELRGVTFGTMYDADDGSILPIDSAIGATGSKVSRIEIITPEFWHVYLGGELTAKDPITGELWMPDKGGANPFRCVPAAILWNYRHAMMLEGKSDIDPAYKLAEQISRSYSMLLQNIDHYFPTLTVPGGDNTSPLMAGIGLAIGHDENTSAPGYIIPMLNVETLMAPFRTQLNLFFSLCHTPASSHGLGAVFGEAQAAESGRAKFYEFSRLERHVAKKRQSFEKFARARWRTLAEFINNGTGIGQVDPNADVVIEWASDIVPVSEDERIDTIIKKMKAQLMSHLEAVMEDRGISAEEAQAIVDDIGVQAGKVEPVDPFENEMKQKLTGKASGPDQRT